MANEQFVIRLGLNSSGVATGANSAIGQIQRIYGGVQSTLSKLAPIGTAIAGAFKLFSGATSAANELNDAADSAETTARAMQALRFAGEALKVPFEDIVTVIDKIKKAQSEALQGNESQIKDFRRIGMSVQDLKKMGGEEIFLRISAAVAKGEVSIANYANVINILGRDSRKILPNLKNDFNKLANEFDASGNAIPRGLVDSLDEADKETSKLWARIKARWRSETAGLAGTIKNIMDAGRGVRDTLKGGPWPGTGSDEALRERGTDSFAKIILGDDKDFDEALDNATRLENQLKRLTAIKALEKFKREEAEAKEAKEQKKKEADEAKSLERAREEGNKRGEPTSDALARIGGHRGGTGAFERVHHQQLGALNRIERHLSRIERHTGRDFGIRGPSPEVAAVLRRVDNYFRFGTDEFE